MVPSLANQCQYTVFTLIAAATDIRLLPVRASRGARHEARRTTLIPFSPANRIKPRIVKGELEIFGVGADQDALGLANLTVERVDHDGAPFVGAGTGQQLHGDREDCATVERNIQFDTTLFAFAQHRELHRAAFGDAFPREGHDGVEIHCEAGRGRDDGEELTEFSASEGRRDGWRRRDSAGRTWRRAEGRRPCRWQLAVGSGGQGGSGQRWTRRGSGRRRAARAE